jgi:enoyl-CoA hydratase/carnithine racemase
MSTIDRTDVNGVATLTLNRPEKLNALNVALFVELNTHIQDIATSQETIGCVVLRGAGRCFSAGHDLKDIGSGETVPEDNFQAKVIEALALLPQTVISAVHSHCYTGALELALAGDIIVASSDVRFGDTHAKWALTPRWGGSARLPARVGHHTAMELMMTCRTVEADEALRLGLCDRIFDAQDFEQQVQQYAESILENSWFSLRGIKQLLNATASMPLAQGIGHEIYRGPGRAPDYEKHVAKFGKKD